MQGSCVCCDPYDETINVKNGTNDTIPEQNPRLCSSAVLRRDTLHKWHCPGAESKTVHLLMLFCSTSCGVLCPNDTVPEQNPRLCTCAFLIPAGYSAQMTLSRSRIQNCARVLYYSRVFYDTNDTVPEQNPRLCTCAVLQQGIL